MQAASWAVSLNVYVRVCLCYVCGSVCARPYVLGGHPWEWCPPLPGSWESGSWGERLEGREAAGSLTPSHLLFPRLHFTEEKTSPFLREVQVNLIDFKKCNDFLVYDSYLTPRMMCAGDLRGGRDSCQVRLPGRRLGCWVWSENLVPTVACSRTTSPLLLIMCAPSSPPPHPTPCRETAGGPWSVSRTVAGTWQESLAGAQAVARGTSPVCIPK